MYTRPPRMCLHGIDSSLSVKQQRKTAKGYVKWIRHRNLSDDELPRNSIMIYRYILLLLLLLVVLLNVNSFRRQKKKKMCARKVFVILRTTNTMIAITWR